MNAVTTEAIVLRSYNLAEADRIVLCFTREAGLIRGVAKGARRMKSRFGAGLEPFTVVRLEFREKENRELVTITGVEIIKSHFCLIPGYLAGRRSMVNTECKQVSGPARREGAVMKKSNTDCQRIEYGPHRPSQLFLLRVWIERKDDRHTPDDLAGKVQDPVSGQVQYFNRGMELLRILHCTIYREESGPAGEADNDPPNAAAPQASR